MMNEDNTTISGIFQTVLRYESSGVQILMNAFDEFRKDTRLDIRILEEAISRLDLNFGQFSAGAIRKVLQERLDDIRTRQTDIVAFAKHLGNPIIKQEDIDRAAELVKVFRVKYMHNF